MERSRRNYTRSRIAPGEPREHGWRSGQNGRRVIVHNTLARELGQRLLLWSKLAMAPYGAAGGAGAEVAGIGAVAEGVAVVATQVREYERRAKTRMSAARNMIVRFGSMGSSPSGSRY